jgi:TonB family protein
MRLYILFFFLIFVLNKNFSQSIADKFVVLNTTDTIYIYNTTQGIRYKKIINTPDTIFFNEKGYVFEYNTLDKPSSFIGGAPMLVQWLNDNFRYPDEARANNIAGKVLVKFIVDENGKIINPVIVKSVHQLLDTEALRLVTAMPDWTAGQRAGKKVRSYFTLPINFRLGD